MNGYRSDHSTLSTERRPNRGLAARTQHMLAADDGEKRAIQLPPAYVNKDIADSEAVRDIVKFANTLEETLSNLAGVLDPPMDTFIAMQEVSRLHWQPGQDIGEYFFLLKRKATYAKLGLKHVASLLPAHAPRDVQTRIKAAVTGINDSLEHETLINSSGQLKLN